MSETTQLLILGNGFDLHCGLESSYKDFFEIEILDIILEKDWNITKMRNDCSGFWENLFLQYYLKRRNDNYKWCDIESIVKETLFTIFIKSHNQFLNNKKIYEVALSNLLDKVPLNEIKCFSKIDEFLIEYIINYFNNTKIIDNLHYDFNTIKIKTIEHLLHELNNLENRFCKYLKNQLINPNNGKETRGTYIFQALNLLIKLTSNYKKNYYNDLIIDIGADDKMFIKDVSEIVSLSLYNRNKSLTKEILTLKSTHILSFNYTNIFDIIQLESPGNYTNVHGKLCTNNCKDCNNSNIIFGIDDTTIQSQSEVPELRLFSKTYRKMKNSSSPLNILPAINNKPLEIKFYGHSLSSADYSYFQSIFDHYNIYENNFVSLIFYYSKGHEQYDAIYDLINIYGNTLVNKNQGKNLMHKLLLENRIKIIEID